MAKPTLFDAWQALVGDPLHNDPIEVDGVLVDRIHCVGEQTPPTDEEILSALNEAHTRPFFLSTR